MNRVVKNLIEYNGIDTHAYKDIVNFKPFNIDKVCCISHESPDVDNIIKVWVSKEIQENTLVKTPKGISYEGQILTGYKSFITGDIKIKAEYSSNKDKCTVHSINFTIPFSSDIALQEDYRDYLITYPSIYTEDIYCEIINPRSIYFNLTLMSIIDVS